MARVCPVCQAPAHYVATFGAPGIGQAWECDQGHGLALVRGHLVDQAQTWDGEPPWIMGPGDAS